MVSICLLPAWGLPVFIPSKQTKTAKYYIFFGWSCLASVIFETENGKSKFLFCVCPVSVPALVLFPSVCLGFVSARALWVWSWVFGASCVPLVGFCGLLWYICARGALSRIFARLRFFFAFILCLSLFVSLCVFVPVLLVVFVSGCGGVVFVVALFLRT